MEENNNGFVPEESPETIPQPTVEHSVPAAGEQVVFEQTPNTNIPQAEPVQTTDTNISQTEPVQTDIPHAEEPKADIPQVEPAQVETPQQQNYQQTPPPMNTGAQQNYSYQQTPPPAGTGSQQQYQQTPPAGTYQYQNQQYQQVPPTPVEPDTTPMTMGNWLVTLLLLMIPCVNIVLMFVWAFGDNTGNLNRKNFARAELILVGVVLAIYLIVIIFMAVAFGIAY